jgi:hypothetical protein
MKNKPILCLALVLSGGLFGCARTPIPPVETAQDSSVESVPKERAGRTFSEIIPPQEVKHILLLDDAVFRNPFLPKPSIQEIQNYYNQLFNYLERSGQITGAPYLADNEMTGAQFAVITSSGDILRVQALSKMGPGGISSVLIPGHGIEARIDIKDFQKSSVTNQPAVAVKQPQLTVETDYLLNQNLGDWAGQRFGQIIPSDKIKRIILLEEVSDVFDYIPNVPKVSTQEEHQNLYGKLFGLFEASTGNAEKLSMTRGESPFARLLLFTDSNQIIYLEIIGNSGRIENGSVVGNHIAGVLIHGPGKSVRINLNIAPVSAAK